VAIRVGHWASAPPAAVLWTCDLSAEYVRINADCDVGASLSPSAAPQAADDPSDPHATIPTAPALLLRVRSRGRLRHRRREARVAHGHTEVGQASYYAAPTTAAPPRAASASTRTSSPPRTAAAVRHARPVTNLTNGKSVVVTITDRGPFKHGRVIDVSDGPRASWASCARAPARVRVQVLST
jgi:rare lipoprotein A